MHEVNQSLYCLLLFLCGTSRATEDITVSLSAQPSQATGSDIVVTSKVPLSISIATLYLNTKQTSNRIAFVIGGTSPFAACFNDTLANINGNCSSRISHNPTQLVVKFFNASSRLSLLIWHIAGVSTEKVIPFDIKDCPKKTLNVGPTISAFDYTYQSVAQFVCPAGQELFYSNSTPGITNTFCQNDATWYGSSGLECWGDPLSNLTGIFSGNEGTIITVYCNPLNMVYPPVMGYNFVMGWTRAKMDHAFILTREMNGKTLKCQAITKYTKIRSKKGWSQPHTLNVTYSPYLFGNYKCIGNEPCNITLSSNPSPHEANLMTGNESKPVTWIKQSNSTHVVQINEPAGNYKLLISNSVGQTSVSVVISTSNTNPPPGNNSALVIGISVAGVVVIGVIIFAVFLWIRKTKAKPGKDSVEFKKNEAVYVNTQVYENTEVQQNTPEYQNIHGTDDNTGNVEKAHLYEVPITLHSKPDSG